MKRLVSALLTAAVVATNTALPAAAETTAVQAVGESIAAVAAKAKPSVVGILTTMKATSSTNRGHAAGTGFVYKDGVLITNAHVVKDAQEVKILYGNGSTEVVPTNQIFADEVSDVAVIKVTAKNLTPLTFANSDNLAVGQQVVAVGNPLGFRLGNSVSQGILSGMGRALGSGYPFLQVDAAINPGNSGGPLFNIKGEVIGINSAKMEDIGVEGLAFAIPINTARMIADRLLSDGKVERATLGIDFQEGWEAYFGVPDTEGVTIGNVISDGPAGLTGLRSGDKLIKLDNKPIYTSDDVNSYLAEKKPGDSVVITVKRRGQVLKTTVKLASMEELRKAAEGQAGQEEGGILIGLTAGQIQEAADYGKQLSRGYTNINRDYVAVSGSNYAVLYTEYLYVARKISSAYEFGFKPGVGYQQAAAKEINNKVEVQLEINGDKENFLDGATFFLEQKDTARVVGAVSGPVGYTVSADGSSVTGNLSVRFPTSGMNSTKDMVLTVKLADGKTLTFQFTIKDLR